MEKKKNSLRCDFCQGEILDKENCLQTAHDHDQTIKIIYCPECVDMINEYRSENKEYRYAPS